jgi:hypothetical protein
VGAADEEADTERVQLAERQADGRLLYRLKHRWRDGTTHVVFEPGRCLDAFDRAAREAGDSSEELRVRMKSHLGVLL